MLVETFGGLGPALVEEADSWRQTLYLGGQRVLHRLRLLVVVRVFDDAAELMSSLSTRLTLKSMPIQVSIGMLRPPDYLCFNLEYSWLSPPWRVCSRTKSHLKQPYVSRHLSS